MDFDFKHRRSFAHLPVEISITDMLATLCLFSNKCRSDDDLVKSNDISVMLPCIKVKEGEKVG